MIKAAYFPTIIYAKDVNLDNGLFEREVLAWADRDKGVKRTNMKGWHSQTNICLLYTSPSPRDATLSRMPSSA